MTTSYWRRTTALGTIEVDAVVVGAGICGISAALHLQRRGLRVAVVERHVLAAGASSRNAGFLMRGAAENYALAVKQYGRDLARTVWRWTEENLAGLREEGIGTGVPTYRATPSCLLALEDVELGELRESERLLREDGFRVGWLESGSDAAWAKGRPGKLRPLGGLVNPDDGACNPVDVMRFLARKLSRPVDEGQEVQAITPADRGDGIIVRTTDGTFRAAHALVCTNAYTPLLLPRDPAGAVRPRRGQMLAIRAGSLKLDCSYYANHGYEYFRQATDGTIVVGGCRRAFAEAEQGYEDKTTREVQGALEAFARSMLGLEELDVVGRWSGTMGFSPDGLPLIGPVMKGAGSGGGKDELPPGSVWFCGGFTGHGMSMAHRCAKAAVEAMLSGETGERSSLNPLPLSRVEGPASQAG